MTTMITEIFDALKAAGAPEDKDQAAASAVAEFTSDMADFRSDQKLMKWMLGFNLAATFAILVKIMAA